LKAESLLLSVKALCAGNVAGPAPALLPATHCFDFQGIESGASRFYGIIASLVSLHFNPRIFTMPVPSPLILALVAVVALFGLYRLVRYLRDRNKTYAQLLAEFEALETAVNEWRHPNGLPVEAHERGRLNAQYMKAWRRLLKHPDHKPEAEV
jgi:hypothetical protein